MKLRLPTLLLLLLCSCASENGTDDDGSSTPKDAGGMDSGAADTGVNLGFNAQEAATDIATAQCAYFTRCIPELFEIDQSDEAACVSETTDAIVANFEELAPMVEAGRIIYNESQKDACVQALQAADCLLGLPDGTACDRVLTGTQEANEPCFFANECAPNLYCNRAQGIGSCGACAAAPAKGAACDPFTPCVDNARCLDIGQQGAPNFVCIPIDAQPGGTCLTVETGLCQGNQSCIGDGMNFTCQPPGGSGATCDNDPNTFMLADCDLNNGYACDGAMCTDVSWSDLSGTCNDTTFCREGFCSNGSCAPLPSVGMSCAMVGACGEDAFCDGTNCLPLIADGQPCNFSGECTGELICLGAGVNRQGTCGVLEWQLCQ